MSQIDASIPLRAGQGITPIDNPMDVQSKALQLRQLTGQVQDSDRARQQQQTLSDLYAGSVGQDGSLDRNKILTGAAQRGLGSQIPGMQKGFADQDKAKLDAEGQHLKVAKERIDMAGSAISSLLSNPQVTHNDVIATITNLVQQGIIKPEQGAQMTRQLPGNPAMLRQFLIQKGIETMDASKRMETMMPQYTFQDTGGQVTPMDKNPITNPNPEPVKKTLSPGERQTATQKKFVPVDGVGLYVGDPNTGTAQPVMGPDGKPVIPRKNLTEGQAKANIFATRMQESNKLLTQLAGRGVDAPSLTQQVVPGNGMMETVANAAASPDQQQVQQAQRDFINAVLRRESGAVISDSEFANARKQYFPQPGEDQKVKANKARNREIAIQTMMAEVPEGQRTDASAIPGGAGGGIGGIDTTAIEAELARRKGGK